MRDYYRISNNFWIYHALHFLLRRHIKMSNGWIIALFYMSNVVKSHNLFLVTFYWSVSLHYLSCDERHKNLICTKFSNINFKRHLTLVLSHITTHSTYLIKKKHHPFDFIYGLVWTNIIESDRKETNIITKTNRGGFLLFNVC